MLEKKKKKVFIIGGSIFVGLIMLFGISYAWFQVTLYGNKTNTIRVGNLSLVIKNELNEINLSDVYAMSDSVGLDTVPYTFTLENNGNVPLDYSIRLIDDSEAFNNCSDCKRLPSSSIKYQLLEGTNTYGPFILSSDRIIDLGTIEPGEMNKKEYTLRLWLDNDVYLDEESQNAVFYSKIEVTADQQGRITKLKDVILDQEKLGTNGVIDKESLVNMSLIKGQDPNNYVWYSGVLWRVISVDMDGSMRLISNDNITSIGYSDITNDFRNSSIYIWLNKYFLRHLKNTISPNLKSTLVCTDSSEDPLRANTVCNTAELSSVGLLSLDEYNLLGGASSYIKGSNVWWLVTKNNTGNQNYVVDAINGNVVASDNSIPHDVRPVITLKANVSISSGNGTSSNPYILLNDSASISGELIQNRYSGEYLRYDDKLWRIIDSNDVGTKIIYSGPVITNLGDSGAFSFGDDNTFSFKSGVLFEIQDIVTNKTSVIENTFFYQSNYQFGGNVLDTSLKDVIRTGLRGTVTLPRIGEMFASGTGYDYWTMTIDDSTSTNAYVINADGTVTSLETSAQKQVRPVVYLKNDAVIQSGSGTLMNPYIIN